MKKLIILSLVWVLCTHMGAQRTDRKLYSVAFYNLENLFDTIHDDGKKDYDFLPDGKYAWTQHKYQSKLNNLAKVLSSLSRDQVPEGPAFIGVAEVENSRVLADLLSVPSMKQYRFIHCEGPDARGIDCALLYDPQQFTVESSRLFLSAPYNGDRGHLTRGFLVVKGKLAGDDVCVIVNHWPSRFSEKGYRINAALQVRHITDLLLRENKKQKIVVMGDLNDDPMDESLQALRARKWKEKVRRREYYNPWWETLEDKGIGTLSYQGKWNLFDQIVLSKQFLKDKKGLHYDHNEVYRRDYLLQHEGKYAGTPLRTHGGKRWLNGYSDHLPTIVYLSMD